MADWRTAERRLMRDKVLRPLIKRIGPCTLEPLQREPYEALVRAIAHQQVHGNAARAVLGRLCNLYPGEAFPPAGFVTALPTEALRGCGFSGSKVLAIQDIAAKTLCGVVPDLEEAGAVENAALIERLVTLRGVGCWTVEMLLIFTLGRSDVLPVDDFGVREGWRLLNEDEVQIKSRDLAVIGEAWRPWRSIAAWYLWRAADEGKRIRVSAV